MSGPLNEGPAALILSEMSDKEVAAALFAATLTALYTAGHSEEADEVMGHMRDHMAINALASLASVLGLLLERESGRSINGYLTTITNSLAKELADRAVTNVD